MVFGGDDGRIRDFDGDTEKPAVSSPRDGAGQPVADKAHPSQFRNMHLTALDGALIIGEGKAVVMAVLLERGILDDAGEAIRQRWAPVDDRPLHGVFRHVEHPRTRVRFDDMELAPSDGLGQVGSDGLAEIRLLHLVGIEGNFMGQTHDDASSTACFTPSSTC